MIRAVRFTAASERDRQAGLLGWVSCMVGDLLQLDGIAVRITRGGALTLSFPERRGRGGERHPYMRPIGDGARRTIEQVILAAIDINGIDGAVGRGTRGRSANGLHSGPANGSHSAGLGATWAQQPRQRGEAQ